MLPILYSFRRCPYAMRARYALAYSGVEYEHREVDLKNKPPQLFEVSSKGTVPVLVLEGGTVIDESLDIIYYALSVYDPDGWNEYPKHQQQAISVIIEQNDQEFTKLLRRYKYFEDYPEYSQQQYRQQIEDGFLLAMDKVLQEQAFLMGDAISVADIVVFPFYRQFSMVDQEWFDNAGYGGVQRWLKSFLASQLFVDIMVKHQPWSDVS